MRPIVRTTLAAVCLCVASVQARESLAAEPPSAPPPAPSSATVEQLFDRGNEFYKQSRFAEAEEAFQAAWNEKHTFDLAANLGDCELHIGQNTDAAQHLAYAMREFPVSGKPSIRTRLEGLFTEAKSRVGGFAIQVTVEGAAVYVDGRPVGVAPLVDPVFVEPGPHEITAQLGAYETGHVTMAVEKGAIVPVQLVLAEEVGAPFRPKRGIVIAGLATTAAGIATGVVFSALATSKSSDANHQRDTLKDQGGPTACQTASAGCATLHGTRVDAATFTNVAGWAFIGAGVVGLGTLAYGVFPGTTPSRKEVSVTPLVGPGSGGVLLTGRW